MQRAVRAGGALALLAASCSIEPSFGASTAGARVAAPVIHALERSDRARVLIETSDVASAREVGRALGAARTFDRVPALATWISAPQLEALREHAGVRAIALDEGGTAHLAEALPLAGFEGLGLAGLNGQGITVAIIDSGIDRSHPDLASAVIDEACFCGSGCCPGGATEAFGEGSAPDDNGHGTHVAGIVAGRGGAAGQPGGAPAVQVIAIKVLDALNAFCCTSDLVAALDWLPVHHPEVDLINMSLGANGLYGGNCDAEAPVGPVATAARALTDLGALLVASSGNNGMLGLPAPACVSEVVSVGAVWDDDHGAQGIYCSEPSTAADQIACFSNASPTLDVLAPGAIVTSTWPVGLTRGRAGTSQAAPIATACAALLRQAEPSASPAELTAALRTSPTWLTDARNGLGYPRLDCGAALGALTGVASDGGADESDASIADASTPMDASLDAGDEPADSSVEAGADAGTDASTPAADSAIGAEDASANDAAAEGGGPDAPELPDSGDQAARDAMANGEPDAELEPDPDAAGDPQITTPVATADCACTTAGARPSSAGPHAALVLAIGWLVRLRARRRSRR